MRCKAYSAYSLERSRCSTTPDRRRKIAEASDRPLNMPLCRVEAAGHTQARVDRWGRAGACVCVVCVTLKAARWRMASVAKTEGGPLSPRKRRARNVKLYAVFMPEMRPKRGKTAQDGARRAFCKWLNDKTLQDGARRGKVVWVAFESCAFNRTLPTLRRGVKRCVD